MEQLGEERKRAPRDDLTSCLVSADDEDDGLTPVEIVGICRALLVAGYETTCNLIGNAMWSMFELPEAWSRLQAEPELLASAVEEALRYRSPGQFSGRLARKDVELAGQSIHAGQRVLVFNGSANRDPAVFPEPDRFDIARTPNRHLAFGHGVHTCLGAMLARAEARIALRALLERLPGLTPEEGTVLEPLASRMIFGVARLPVRFASAARPVV
jgi:cytochrome P450